jgi:hypothetical protein
LESIYKNLKNPELAIVEPMSSGHGLVSPILDWRADMQVSAGQVCCYLMAAHLLLVHQAELRCKQSPPSNTVIAQDYTTDSLKLIFRNDPGFFLLLLINVFFLYYLIFLFRRGFSSR